MIHRMFLSILSCLFLLSSRAQCPVDEVLLITDTWQTVSSSYEADGSRVYEVYFDLGVNYYFKTGCGDGATADHNTVIELLTPPCDLIMANDDGCEQGRSFLSFGNSLFGDGLPLRIRVSGSGGAGGSYTMAYRTVHGTPGICDECPSSDQQIQPNSIWQNASASYADGGCHVYRITMVAGTQYSFKTGCGNGADADHDTVLELSETAGWPTCAIVAEDDDSCEEGRSEVVWTAPTNGQRFLKVRSATGGAGAFTLAYRSSGGNGIACIGCPSHDFSITPGSNWLTSTSGHLADGCMIYRVSTTPGHDLAFKTGCGDGATAEYSTRLELYDASCELLAMDEDGCEEGGSFLNWSVTSGGFLYLKVSGQGDQEGLYTLAYRRSITPAPCTNCPSSDAILDPSPGWQVTTSSHGPLGCVLYEVPVQQGHTYVFQTGCGEGAATDHPTILEVLDAGCGVLSVSDAQPCDGPGSRIYHGAEEDGTVFLKVRGVGESAGEFSLAWRDMGGAADECADVMMAPLDLWGSIPFTGDITLATPDASPPDPSLQGLPLLWHGFSINECMDVKVDYCMDPPWSNVLQGIVGECEEGSLMAPLWSGAWSCPEGVEMWYSQLQAGNYRVPVLYDPVNGPEGAYLITVWGQQCGTLGVMHRAGSGSSLRPNPTSGNFTLQNEGTRTIERIDVVDLNGRIIRSWNGSIPPEAEREIDASGLSPAVYVVHVWEPSGGRQAIRLVVQGISSGE